MGEGCGGSVETWGVGFGVADPGRGLWEPFVTVGSMALRDVHVRGYAAACVVMLPGRIWLLLNEQGERIW